MNTQWEPMSKSELDKLILPINSQLKTIHLQFWNAIRIPPEKWALPPWGDEGLGFWVVGVYGNNVIWYNDIEDGFNISNYRQNGVINEYWCSQDELQFCVRNAYNQIFNPDIQTYKMSPPIPLQSSSTQHYQ